jgi:thioester reductase-like protein
MSDHVLLTGATGYVGQALLCKWLRETDATFSLLIRGRRGESPLDRARTALREFTGADPDPWMGRIECADADVSQERLGLAPKEYEDLARRTTQIIHCAAAARFDLSLEDARRTNVDGPRHILEFATACSGLERIDYIGTAYVCGRRVGLVMEDDLDTGQEHRNTYERSKFEAETMMRGEMKRLPITILRPSIVICDSRTGYASNHNGFFRALRMYLKGGLDVLPGTPSSLLDLVPVDYVANAVHKLALTRESIGRCYHLTAGTSRSTTLGEIRDLAAKHSGLRPFRLLGPEEFAGLTAQMATRLPEQDLKGLREMELYMPYLLCEHQFDTTHTLRDAGMQAPPIGDYFAKFVEYILRAG